MTKPPKLTPHSAEEQANLLKAKEKPLGKAVDSPVEDSPIGWEANLPIQPTTAEAGHYDARTATPSGRQGAMGIPGAGGAANAIAPTMPGGVQVSRDAAPTVPPIHGANTSGSAGSSTNANSGSSSRLANTDSHLAEGGVPGIGTGALSSPSRLTEHQTSSGSGSAGTMVGSNGTSHLTGGATTGTGTSAGTAAPNLAPHQVSQPSATGTATPGLVPQLDPAQTHTPNLAPHQVPQPSATGTATPGMVPHHTLAATVQLDPITPDNVLNAPEASGQISVTGSVGGEVQDGNIVTLHLGGHSYSGPVQGGRFSIDLPGVELAKHTDIIAVVNAGDTLGNTGQSAVDLPYQTDLQATTAGDVNAVKEDTQPATSGNVLSNDEQGSQVSNPGNLAGRHGTLVLGADGSYTYTLDSHAQTLGEGETQQETFTYQTTDAAGNSGSASLIITLTGTNDAPTLMALQPMVTYEGSPVIHSRLFAIDVDDHDTLSYHATAPVAGFTLNADGSYTFDPADPAYEHLGFGQHQIVNIPVEVTDAAGATASRTIEITITGTNDAPTLNIVPPRQVVEGGSTVSGQLTATDPDDGATLTFSRGQPLEGLTLYPDGRYSFDPADPHYNSLPAGQTLTLSVPVLVTDSHGGTGTTQLQITITGTNDVPVVAGIDHAIGDVASTQAGRVRVDGQLAVIDLDQGESHFQGQLLTGSYGVLEIQADGHWHYTADAANPALANLGANAHVDEHFTVRTADGTAHSIDLQLKGSNTPAIFAGTAAAMVQEDQASTIGHHLDVKDSNAGEDAFQPVDQAMHYGHFTLSATGDWTYQLDNANPDVQALVAGKTLTDSITVGSVDGTPKVISVTIMGTNDVAVISGSHTGGVIEDNTGTTLTTDGQLTVTDPDAGQDHFIAMQGIPGDHGYGSFSVDAQGHWTYTADNSLPAIQALQAGATATDSFTVMAADGTKQTVTVTLTGTNDTAVITGTDTGSVTEETAISVAGTITASGKLLVADVDTGEAHFTFQDQVIGSGGYGKFMITPSGAWIYGADASNPAIQALKAGETVTDTLTVSSVDGTQQQITVTLTGTNDAARIAGTQSGAVTEESALSTHGTLTVADVDRGEAAFTPAVLTGSHGSFTIDGAGHWAYTLDNSNPTVQALGVGDKLTDVLTVTSLDGTPQQVTVSINGTNDAAQIGGSHTGAVTEDTALTTQGTLTVSDTDSGEASFKPETLASQYGQLTVDAAGHWTYTLDNANPTVQALGAQGQLTDTITVTSVDGTAQQISISIHGTNDVARIAGTQTGDVTEDQTVVAGRLETGGQLSITDIDAGEDHFTVQINTPGTYGSFSIDPSGHWTYTSDNSQPAFQALKVGESLTDTLQVTSADGTRHTVSVTIHGTNDTPVLAAQTQAVAEDGALLSGKMVATDVDKGDTQTFNTQNPPAGFTLDVDGSYSFDPSHAAYQHLPAGQTQDLTIPVTVTDSAGAISTQNLIITVTGAADGAIIGGVDTGGVTEDVSVTTGKIGTSGQLNVTDLDTGEDHFQAQASVAGSNHYGSFSLDAYGYWSFSADNSQAAIQQLKAGEQLTDSLTVTSVDGTTHMVTVTLTGSNDVPVLSGQSQSVTEDGALLTGRMVATDVDKGDTQAFSTQNPPAGFTLNPDGSYRFDPSDTAYQRLAAGQTQDLIIPVTVTDSAGATGTQNLVITVTGTNDLPVVAGDIAGAVMEDSATQRITGQLTTTDADTGDHTTWNTINAPGTYGSFAMGADGAWYYQLNNAGSAVQSLAAGQVSTEQFIAHGTDGHGGDVTQTIEIRVTGANDAAKITGQIIGSVTEDHAGGLLASGRIMLSDVDAGQGQLVEQTIAGQHGTLTLLADGSWRYAGHNADPAVQALGAGKTLTDVVNLATPEGGTQAITITFAGVNDRAVIAGASTTTVTEDGSVTADGKIEASGQLTVTDVDIGEAVFAAQTNVAGSNHYGTFSIDAAGHWTYSADNGNATIQGLKAGTTLTDMLTVQSADGTSHTVTVTLRGTNDAPVLSAQANAVSEDGAKLTGRMVATDVDTGDTQAFSATNPPAGFTLSADGSYTFDPSYGAYQHLAAGQTETLTIPVTVTDSAGATSTQNLTITISGTDDKPIIGGVSSGATSEDSTQAVSGQLTVSDIDDGQTHFTAQGGTAGSYGNLTLSEDGHWSYQLDNSKPDVQALKTGQTVTDSFTVLSADGTPHQITVAIRGRDDGAVIGGSDTGSVKEDRDVQGGLLETGGHLAVTDPDADQSGFVAQSDVAGRYGHFSMDVTGAWSYRADNSSSGIEALREGAVVEDHFVVHSLDGTTHTVRVTLQGSNDAPSLSASSHAVAEDGALVFGQMHATDRDLGDALIFDTPTIVAGFTLHSDGTYRFDPKDPAYQGLAEGQQLQLRIPITVTDNSGETVRHSVIILLTGRNDGATISGIDTGSVTEDSARQASGSLSVSDVDFGEVHFRAGDISGQFGVLHLDASGQWTYDLDNALVQKVGAGETALDTLNVLSADGTAHQIAISIHGTNDAPTIGGINTGTVSEDGSLIAAGQLSIVDADAGQSSFQAQPGATGQHGEFSLAADGSWRYALNNSDTDVQALTKGQRLTDSLTVRSADGSTHTITVTIQGRDDGAVIAGVDTGRVTEDQSLNVGRLQTGGQLTLAEADGGQHTFTVQNQVAGHYGSFSIDASGHWTYSADNSQEAIQHLGRNDSLQDRFQVTSADGTRHTVIVTLQGSNDAPVLASQSRSVTEDGAILTGQMRASDADANDLLVYSTQQQIAGFTLNTDGSYSFDPRTSAYQLLGAGAAETLHIPITVRDQSGAKHTQDLLITVTGTNDGAVIRGNDTGDVVEDLNVKRGLLTTQGHLGILDPDAAQSSFVEQTGVAGRYGHFSIDAAGAWTYEADNNGNRLQELREGAQAVEHFVVRSLDGTTHSIRVTVHGTNDAPVVTSSAQTVAEDGSLLFGQLRVTDPDRSDQPHFQLDHPVAGFTLNSDGTYHFDPKDTAHQDLREGQVMRLDVPVTVTDSAGAAVHHTIAISMTGRNDAAVITGADSATVVEDSQVQSGLLRAGGQIHVTDIDAGEDLFVVQSGVAGSHGLGHFSLNAAGQWLYTADNTQTAVQQLKAGESLTDSFTVQSADGTAHTVTVSIQGSNDAPVLVAQTRAVDAGGTRLSGHMVATDVDQGDTQVFSTAAHIAGFTLNADGSYTFDPSNAAYQHLAGGQAQDLVIPITITDSAGSTNTQSLTITVTGVSHGAVITGVDTGKITENAAQDVVGGQLHITDPDSGEAHFVAQSQVQAQHGHFSLQEDGAWTYTLDNKDAAVQALKAGESLTEHLTVSSADGTTHVLTVTVQGSNDAPVLQAQSQSVTEDGSLLRGHMAAQDVDHGDALRFTTPAAVGGFTLNADGSYSFDPSHHDYQSLGQGQTRDIDIPITVTDSAGATATQMLRIHITGRDDRTSIYGVDSGQVQAGVHPETSGELHASDDDAGQSGFRAGTVNGSFGSLTIDAQGHWTYRVDGNDSFILHLLPNSHITEQVTVHSVDGTAHDIEVQVEGAPAGSAPPPAPPAAEAPAADESDLAMSDSADMQPDAPAEHCVTLSWSGGSFSLQNLDDQTAENGGADSPEVAFIDDTSQWASQVQGIRIDGQDVPIAPVYDTDWTGNALVTFPGLDRSLLEGHTVELKLAEGAPDQIQWTVVGHSALGWGSSLQGVLGSSAPSDDGDTAVAADSGDADIPLAPDAMTGDIGDVTTDMGDSLTSYETSATDTTDTESSDTPATDTSHTTYSPLADYLQFADTTHEVGAGRTADADTTAVDDYLAAAGVDPADTSGTTTYDLPPIEVLVDDAAHVTATSDHDTTTTDDALAAVPADLLDQPPQEDPQHHGV